MTGTEGVKSARNDIRTYPRFGSRVENDDASKLRAARQFNKMVRLCVERWKKPSDPIVIPGRQLGVFIPDTSEYRGMQSGDAVSILPYAGPYPMFQGPSGTGSG